MVLGSHANTRAMYSTPPWPSLAASMAAYRRRSFSDNHPKKRCIFSSISAEYTSMLDSLSQNLCCRKDTTAQACREVILDHILIVFVQYERCRRQRPNGVQRARCHDSFWCKGHDNRSVLVCCGIASILPYTGRSKFAGNLNIEPSVPLWWTCGCRQNPLSWSPMCKPACKGG